MICPKCRKSYNNRVTYCISCGAQLVPDDTDLGEEPAEGEFSAEPADGVFENFPVDGGFVRNISMPSAAERTECITKTSLNVKEGRTAAEIGKSVLKKAASVCLSVLLLGISALAFGTVSGRIITDKSCVSAAVRSIDLLSIPADELGLPEVSDFDIPQGATVEEAVTVMTAGSGVTSGNIRRIYENSTLKEFISGIAEEYAEYLRNGTTPDKITSERIKSVFSENISVINSNTGYELSDADIQLAYSEIEQSEKILSELSVSNIENGAAGNYIRTARAYISVPALIAELAAAAVLIALLAAINKNASRVLKFVGIPILAVGAAALAAVFMFSMQIGLFSEFSGLALEVVKGFSEAASGSLYQLGAALFILGGAATAVGEVLRRQNK